MPVSAVTSSDLARLPRPGSGQGRRRGSLAPRDRCGTAARGARRVAPAVRSARTQSAI